ncbi:hypothetical protein EDD37DRAFT_305872 [Exophiala viscosa]|uniref:uncharacterized protein n=1 Tax=Exophiala viscosa TaxID=2486360 RepID=UPI00218DAC8D|nr:hypothetical protein EDD37DRAFT_305872 [Exophiala viscosa]
MGARSNGPNLPYIPPLPVGTTPWRARIFVCLRLLALWRCHTGERDLLITMAVSSIVGLIDLLSRLQGFPLKVNADTSTPRKSIKSRGFQLQGEFSHSSRKPCLTVCPGSIRLAAVPARPNRTEALALQSASEHLVGSSTGGRKQPLSATKRPRLRDAKK